MRLSTVMADRKLRRGISLVYLGVSLIFYDPDRFSGYACFVAALAGASAVAMIIWIAREPSWDIRQETIDRQRYQTRDSGRDVLRSENDSRLSVKQRPPHGCQSSSGDNEENL